MYVLQESQQSRPALRKLESKINEELVLVHNWLNDNQLTLNIKKTNYIIFKTTRKKKNLNISLIMNNQHIRNVKETKFLGIIIDEHLTWKSHIDCIAKKLLRTSGILCKVRHYLDKHHLLTLYYTLAYPYLYYCNIIWANNYKTRLMKLFVLQKKIIRLITFSSYVAPSSPLFLTLKLLNIQQINTLQIGLFTFDLLNNRLPSQFNSFCINNNVVHNYNTRGSSKLHKQYHKTNYGLYSTRNKCTIVWNMLPLNITISRSNCIFKRNLKSHLLCPDNCYDRH